MISQVVSNRYVEKSRLTQLLHRLFGTNYEVEDHDEYYALTIPRELTICTSRPAASARRIMEELEASIRSQRRQNFEYRYFVPHQALLDLLTEATVSRAIEDTTIERYHISELSRTVIIGARKVFAILILTHQPQSILAFIEDDQLQNSFLDHKLPFSREKLRIILPDTEAVEKFYEAQWQFTAPIFTGSALPRVLENEVVLPFVELKEIGEGGFGIVHQITVEHSHQEFGRIPQDYLVRKEFRTWSNQKSDYELELRNLSILKLIKHPNIIELLGCYTHRNKHNFLFPLVRGGTLANLLTRELLPAFQTDDALIIAVCGLSSALRLVHDFVSDELKAIGAHHDLKPSNILVDDGKFLLADFGLSRFKESYQDSATLFREGRGDYLAPECEDLEDAFEKHIVRRSSDIWSFGCILAELLVYMVNGAEGVTDFKSKRAFKVSNYKFFRFHCGPGKANAAVQEYLASLKLAGNTSGGLLAQLIQRMLSILPEDRPNIKKVDAIVRFIAVESLTQPIELAYGTTCQKSNSIYALLERGRFRSWKWVLGRTQDGGQEEHEGFLGALSLSQFGNVLTHLQQLKEILQERISESQTSQALVFLPLRRLNDTLWSILPGAMQVSAATHYEWEVLRTEDSALLHGLSGLDQENPHHYRQIAQLAAIKRLHILVEEQSTIQNPHPQINFKQLYHRQPLGDFYESMLIEREKAKELNVLEERKTYAEHYSDENIAKELFARLGAIVDLLNKAHEREALCVLHCRGFYHDPAGHALCLVYEFPQSPRFGHEKPSAITLRKILEDDPRGKRRPDLGDRFRLAHKLAEYVLEFHKLNWLHKGISSFNIVFFYPEGSSRETFLDAPYFLGFLSSRQNEESAFTEGPTDDSRHKDYQHPEYLGGRVRFRSEFDYYSLGIVLVELGLWNSLSDMTASKDFSGGPDKFRKALIAKAIPRLGQAMGARYRDAVKVCLLGDDGSTAEVDNEGVPDICLRFKEQVVDRLASCRV